MEIQESAIVQPLPPSDEEKERGLRLFEKRECPHCHLAISLADAIAMVQGSGWEAWTRVEGPDGKMISLRRADVNPQTMRVIEP